MHLSLITALSLSFVALSFQQNAAPSLKDLLAEQKNLTSFTNFLTNSLPDLLSELEAQEESRQPVTILAPSNAAFDKIPYYSVIGPAWGSGNLDAQREIMKYHILPGDITTDVLLPTFQYFPTWLTNSNFANVTNGQRVGAVMQGGKLLFFVSGTSNRSPSTVTDLKFAGGFVLLQKRLERLAQRACHEADRSPKYGPHPRFPPHPTRVLCHHLRQIQHRLRTNHDKLFPGRRLRKQKRFPDLSHQWRQGYHHLRSK